MTLSDVICTLPAERPPATRDDVDATGMYLWAPVCAVAFWLPVLYWVLG